MNDDLQTQTEIRLGVREYMCMYVSVCGACVGMFMMFSIRRFPALRPVQVIWFGVSFKLLFSIREASNAPVFVYFIFIALNGY